MIAARRRTNSSEEHLYASDDDFRRLFAVEIGYLFRLSLLLTADAENAEHCLALAMADCFGAKTIFKDFARVWARRMIIQNAIQLVMTDGSAAGTSARVECSVDSGDFHKDEHLKLAAVLGLATLDRLTYVICILERLSIADCALHLRKSSQEVKDAVTRAANQIASVGSSCRTCFNVSDSRHSSQQMSLPASFILQELAS